MQKIILSVTAIAAAAGTASAQITVFNDRASWEAALGGAVPVVEDFNAVTPFVFSDGQTLDTDILQVTRDGSANGGDGELAISDGSTFGDIDGTNFLDGETGAAPHERVDFGFSGQAVFAFGADFSSPFSGDGIALEVGDQLFNLDSISGFDTGFFGIVSASDTYTSISIVGTPADISFQELWQADNVSYAVPAPGAAGLLGLAGLAATRRRR
jgi:hypothetical protein